MPIRGTGQLTLTDLNDAIISGTQPSNPSIGQLWVDESTSPKKLKKWDGSTWVIIGEVMDDGTGTIIEDIEATLGNMANDNILDFSERQIIKDKLTEIIGYVIADATTTLPTTATNDAGTSGKGSFHYVRKNATMAGLSTSDAKYIAVATAWDGVNGLKPYLEGLTPIDAWDLSTANKNTNITVVKSTFRDKWLTYYKAELDLANATADQLKKNVDNVAVGGTNYGSNGDFSISLTKGLWNASYVGQTKSIIDISTEKPPFQFAYYVKNTTNANGGILSPTLFSGASAEALVNKEITITFWAKYSGIVQGTSAWQLGRFGELVVEGETATATKVYSYPRASNVNADSTNQTSSEVYYFSGTDTTWRKYVVTHKLTLPATAVKLTKISFKHGLENCVGEFWTTGIKIEIGNKATDWSQSPYDITNRFTDVEFKVTPDQIMASISSSEVYNATIPVNAGDWTFEKGVEMWRQDHDLTQTVTGATVVANATGASSKNVIQITGQKYLFYNRKIPISTGRRYKITFRVRQTTDAGVAGTAKVYAGVGAYDANKNKLTTATYGSHRYVAIDAKELTVADGWMEFSEIITGEGEDGGYDKFITGTKYVTPMCIVNYSNGSGTVQIDTLKIEDVTDLDQIAVQVKNMSLILNDDGLTAEIGKTTFYKNLYGGTDAEGNPIEGALSKKADSSALGNYQSKDDFQDFKDNDFDGMVDDRLSTQMSDEESDLNKHYATKTELKATATDITAKFSATGGMNLLKNSIGFSDLITKAEADAGTKGQNWFLQGVQSRFESTQGGQLDTLGFGSGFRLKPSTTATSDTSIDQYVTVLPNKTYTLSWYINKSNNSVADGHVEIYVYKHGTTTKIPLTYLDPNDPDQITWLNQTDYVYGTTKTTDGYESAWVKFTPDVSKIHLRIYGHGFSDITISGLMLTIGDQPLQWSLATGESYNTNVRLDLNGIRVSQLDSAKEEIGYTQITPSEFAGYYKNIQGQYEKVFYLNGDETVTKKLKATSEITMGSLKIIRVESGGNNGWAFVPIVPE